MGISDGAEADKPCQGRAGCVKGCGDGVNT